MRIYYQEPNGDYLAINTETHDLYHYTGKSQYEGRATAIYDLVTSVCTTAISTEYLADCAEIDKADVPAEWLEAIGGEEEPDFYLGDDGTLDTVIACATCGWEGRFNPEPTGMDDESDDGWRVRAALEMAEEDHVCGEDD